MATFNNYGMGSVYGISLLSTDLVAAIPDGILTEPATWRQLRDEYLARAITPRGQGPAMPRGNRKARRRAR